MGYYIFLFVLLLLILFLFFNYERIKYVTERQGLADENSGYIYPQVVNNFINNDQNKYILEYAKPRFQPSVVGVGLFNEVDGSVRNSQTAWVPKENPVVKEIIINLCNKYNYPFENAEDLQVVKYDKDNFYKEHHDSYPYYQPDFLMQGGHRVLTALIYLNNEFEEGETKFVNLNKKIKPDKNSAIIFHPLDLENKKCHPKALHAGLPIKTGTKYIANIWIREEPFIYDIDFLSYDYFFNSIIVYSQSIINSILTAMKI
jgi:prolyl 4-hydroxylase